MRTKRKTHSGNEPVAKVLRGVASPLKSDNTTIGPARGEAKMQKEARLTREKQNKTKDEQLKQNSTKNSSNYAKTKKVSEGTLRSLGCD